MIALQKQLKTLCRILILSALLICYHPNVDKKVMFYKVALDKKSAKPIDCCLSMFTFLLKTESIILLLGKKVSNKERPFSMHCLVPTMKIEIITVDIPNMYFFIYSRRQIKPIELQLFL